MCFNGSSNIVVLLLDVLREGDVSCSPCMSYVSISYMFFSAFCILSCSPDLPWFHTACKTDTRADDGSVPWRCRPLVTVLYVFLLQNRRVHFCKLSFHSPLFEQTEHFVACSAQCFVLCRCLQEAYVFRKLEDPRVCRPSSASRPGWLVTLLIKSSVRTTLSTCTCCARHQLIILMRSFVGLVTFSARGSLVVTHPTTVWRSLSFPWTSHTHLRKPYQRPVDRFAVFFVAQGHFQHR